jgi:hypothetical protein
MGSHANPQFLYVTTKGWKTGKQHGIEIWFVQYNKRYYIMSELLERAHWVQNIIHDPRSCGCHPHFLFQRGNNSEPWCVGARNFQSA